MMAGSVALIYVYRLTNTTGSRQGRARILPGPRQGPDSYPAEPGRTLGVMTPAGVHTEDMPNGRRFKCDLSIRRGRRWCFGPGRKRASRYRAEGYLSVFSRLPTSQTAAMMLYLILLITAVCSSVCGTSQDGDKKHQMLCKIRQSCQDTDLTKPNPNDTSPANDLCRAAEDDLKSLDPSTCESLLARETYGQGNQDPEQPDSEDGQIFDLIEKLLSREIEDQTDNDQPEKPDNVDGQTTHTDPAPPALSKRGNYFSDCSEIHTAQSLYHTVSSGVHKIQPVGLSSPISVYCDQTTDGGGWTVIQRRFDGSIDFNRPYYDFRYGFGSANGEQWLGLENMYRLTNQHTYTLYVQLEDWNSVVKYAKYSSFSVGSSSSTHRLSVSGYSGTAGDGLSSLSGQPFSARNLDRDAWSGGSCAGGRGESTGGWWYKSCSSSALNGPYLRPSDRTSYSGGGIYWNPFGGSYKTYLKKSKMMVRPANFKTIVVKAPFSFLLTCETFIVHDSQPYNKKEQYHPRNQVQGGSLPGSDYYDGDAG
ncbi:hypothetical protein Bbelb_118580 [Branchiostoma belcheri]|nr:hypothetical protein Bbelb_118580 [Branchiostoma belcheri]